MKKFVAVLLAGLWVTSAQAQCSYFTYTINGKTYYCTTCCYGTGNLRTCNTTCT